MDATGQWLLLGVVVIVAIVFGIWRIFIRGHEEENQQLSRTAGLSASALSVERAQATSHGATLRARAPFALKFFACMFTIAALLSAPGLGFRTWMRYDMLRSRLRTDAQVLSSELYSEKYWARGTRAASGGWRTHYGFRCALKYSVDGREYQSLADLGVKSNFRSSVEKWPSRLSPGTEVVVAYDPADPAQVILAGDFQMAYAPLLFGYWLTSILLFAGLSLWIVSKRFQPSIAPDPGV
jgi:hypothetical protein